MEGGDGTVLHKRGLSKKGVWLLIAFVSAGFTAVYMQIEPRWLVCAVVFALLYWRLSRGVKWTTLRIAPILSHVLMGVGAIEVGASMNRSRACPGWRHSWESESFRFLA